LLQNYGINFQRSLRLVPIYHWLRAKRAASSSVKQAVATGVLARRKPH